MKVQLVGSMSKCEKGCDSEHESLHEQMIEEAAEINRPHQRVHEAFSGQWGGANPRVSSCPERRKHAP